MIFLFMQYVFNEADPIVYPLQSSLYVWCTLIMN